MGWTLSEFRTGWLTGGFHLLILYFAFKAESREAWPWAFAAMAVVSFFAWMANYRRYRQVHDVPTSRIASAAQGYVELFGTTENIPDSPVTAPLSAHPCCWYRYALEERGSDNKWREVDRGESVAHFVLKDETGECVISPDGAEILFAGSRTWTDGDRRCTEWLLEPGGILYALGDFRTTGGADLELETNRDVSNLLAEWKRDEPKLLERFDTDRSGTLDLREWERARLEARRDVERQHAQARAGEGVNLLCKPPDGRVFILAAALPEKIGMRYALWSWAHLVFFFGVGAASFVLFTRYQ
jgi:hypothetical protein